MVRDVVIGAALAGVLMVLCGQMSGCRSASIETGEGETLVTAKQAPSIRLEHVALNVPDPVAMAKWYVRNLGMKIMREGAAPANTRFIADAGGTMMLELYHNPPDAVPDYPSMHPLQLHIAFMVDDVAAVHSRLIAVGATPYSDVDTTPAGDILTMLRDPWGIPIQFVKRAEPMLGRE